MSSKPLWAAPVLAFLVLFATFPASAQTQGFGQLPNPLGLEDVLTYGRAHRQEIVAARARASAAAERPAIVSALEDPMVMASVDHLPFMLHGVDASLMVEQRFPLSRVLGHRERAAAADARRVAAESKLVSQDVQLDAARSFLMLFERREMLRTIEPQLSLAREFVAATNARYSSGVGNLAEVYRAELEVSRFEAAIRTLQAEVVAAEAMLNTSLGRSPDAAVPPLAAISRTAEPRAWSAVRKAALRSRPELDVGRAELDRSQAEVSEMESMYWPMGVVRTGPAYTMSDGWGWMLTLGVSIPLQREALAAGVREAKAMGDMARADLAAMTRMVEGEAAMARSQVVAARERVLALQNELLPRARQAIEPSLAAYMAGTLPLVSVIEAVQTLWSIETELVSADFELGLAWTRLKRAEGQFDGGTLP
jgi:outer membrane protein, heavy metal efflux system